MSTLQQRRTAPSVEDDPTMNLMSSMPSLRKGRSFNGKRSKGNSGNLNVSRYPSSVIWGTCIMILIWCLVPWFMIREGYWSANGRLRRQNDPNPQGTNLMSHSSFVVDKTSKLEAMSNQSVAILETDLDDKHNQQQIPPKVLPNYRKLETEVIDMRIMSATLPFDDVDGGVWKQGWDLEPKKITSSSFSSSATTKPLQIFVVPHSHCDPGWIKTFDDYFRTQTSQILTSVIQALAKDKRRKFIWAEISYFEWWWREQSNDTKETVKQLLKNRQLEFVTGGWVQPDEANTQLYAMEVQLQEGHSWIRNNVGEQYIPKYGWSIDPFGYSPTMAYLLRKYDFEGMLIQRVHYAVKKELASKQQLEFLWRQTWDSTGEHDIFTHLMPFYSYDVPHTCGPDPSVCCQFDFARSSWNIYGRCPWGPQPQPITPQNVHERAKLMLDQHLKKASLYRGNAVLIPLGDDFRYRTLEEAEAQYNNFQLLFDYINKNIPNVQIQFGTLSDYFKEVIGKFDTPILKGSFFTYADRAQDYWSGYFTSRVFDKALDRKLERVLYTAERLGATPVEMQGPRRALSLFQHHDGVTGTAKNHVVEDYALRIHNAIRSVQQWIRTKIDIPTTIGSSNDIDACWRSDVPRGLAQNLCGESSQVVVFNPMDYPQSCGKVVVPPLNTKQVDYPCDIIHPENNMKASKFRVPLKFNSQGMLIQPIEEHWMKWKVTAGGAYLFFPGKLEEYSLPGAKIEYGGMVVSTGFWNRTIIRHEYNEDEFGSSSVVLDFIYETNLKVSNEEWFVRFTSHIQNDGVFHTDLNGFNFDTHHFREEMPVQSQVFPMPTFASIEDRNKRMSILSEHSQGTASLASSSIDVWLDRRLAQDDNRGLGQGIMDNVPTRTRLRVVLEKDIPTTQDFQITPLCRRMWDELNHPLEAFGKYASGNAAAVSPKESRSHFELGSVSVPGLKAEPNNQFKRVIPIVIMVFKRVDYLKQSIQSIRDSDVNISSVPIIISQDGNVPEMAKYIESLGNEFRIHRIVHPFSCYEHPNSFPADSLGLLNKNYAGDSYQHPRDGTITCCKHHFTWLIKTLHSNKTIPDIFHSDHFLIMEEDYIVGPNIYETVQQGVSLMDQAKFPPDGTTTELFGVLLDPTDGGSKSFMQNAQAGFYVTPFVTGPMVLSRRVIGRIVEHAKEYCDFDDYNWDWSIVHLQSAFQDFPRACLVPSKPQMKHIGMDGGMHKVDAMKKLRIQSISLESNYHPNKLLAVPVVWPKRVIRKGYGGWGHPADHEHCRQVLEA